MIEHGKEIDGALITRKTPDNDYLIRQKLIAHGWLPVLYDPKPTPDPDTHFVRLSGLYTVGQDDITKHYETVERTAEDKKLIADTKQKASDLAAIMPNRQTFIARAEAVQNVIDIRAFLIELANAIYWDIRNDSE